VNDAIARVIAADRAARDAARDARAAETDRHMAALAARRKAQEEAYKVRPPMNDAEIRAMLADLDLDALTELHAALENDRRARWTAAAGEVVAAAMADGGEGADEVFIPGLALSMGSIRSETVYRRRVRAARAAKEVAEVDAHYTRVSKAVKTMIEARWADIRNGRAS
jgi:hypothetical protein